MWGERVYTLKSVQVKDDVILDQPHNPTNNKDLPREWKFVQKRQMDLILGDPLRGSQPYKPDLVLLAV